MVVMGDDDDDEESSCCDDEQKREWFCSKVNNSKNFCVCVCVTAKHNKTPSKYDKVENGQK